MIRVPLVPRTVRWAAVLAVLILVVGYSVVPLPRSISQFGPLGLLPIRGYLHAISYAGFALVLGYAFADSDRPDWQVLALVFGLSVGIGLALELLQLTLPYRAFSPLDLVMNGLGAMVAVVAWRVLRRRARFYRVESIAVGR